MTTLTRNAVGDPVAKASEERNREERWARWQTKGALADVRTERRAWLLGAALLMGWMGWVAFEIGQGRLIGP